MPASTKTGSSRVVGLLVSTEPPWSTSTSTITLPSFISSTEARSTRCGVFADNLDGADEEIRPRDDLPDTQAARHQRNYPAEAHGLEAPEPFEVSVYDEDLRSEPASHTGGIRADDTRPQNDHAARTDARRAT